MVILWAIAILVVMCYNVITTLEEGSIDETYQLVRREGNFRFRSSFRTASSRAPKSLRRIEDGAAASKKAWQQSYDNVRQQLLISIGVTTGASAAQLFKQIRQGPAFGSPKRTYGVARPAKVREGNLRGSTDPERDREGSQRASVSYGADDHAVMVSRQ